MLAQMVGDDGRVQGIDMTQEQLEVAERGRAQQAEQYQNVSFTQGFIEDLPFEDESFDLVVSNCVVNLSPSKESVFSEAFRVLRSGGEMYFSDVYASRRVPQHLREDEELFGECISGRSTGMTFCTLLVRAGLAIHGS